ncbi:MAG: N-acetylmuramoyl-L-alanine amidase [Cyanobacteria bacterium P01_A01_bin.80]
MYLIDIGHNCSPDTGAICIEDGTISEDVLVKKVANHLFNLFDSHNIYYKNVTPKAAHSVNHSLRQRVGNANAVNGSSHYVSIHFNAFNNPAANGTEVYTFSEMSSVNPKARNVLNNLVKLGYRNRGLKHFPFYVLKHTRMPAMLIECCFITSPTDRKLINTENFAEAIFEGLTGIPVDTEEIEKVSPQSLKTKLLIHTETYLKASTKQISEMVIAEKDDLKKIKIGEYDGELLAMEEGHFLFKFKGGDSFFITEAHSKIQ